VGKEVKKEDADKERKSKKKKTKTQTQNPNLLKFALYIFKTMLKI